MPRGAEVATATSSAAKTLDKFHRQALELLRLEISGRAALTMAGSRPRQLWPAAAGTPAALVALVLLLAAASPLHKEPGTHAAS